MQATASGALPGCLTSKCHDDLVKGFSAHSPLRANRGCFVCHKEGGTPSQSLPRGHASYLRGTAVSIRATCLTCHDAVNDLMISKDHVHAPLAKEGCLECHDPHHSSYPKLLKAEANVSCVGCHKEQGNELLKPSADDVPTLSASHAVALGKDSCIQCHAPHGSTHAKFLKAEPDRFCLSCHDEAVTAKNGKILASMKRWNEKGMHHHGSDLREGSKPVHCISCHQVHDRSRRAILAGNYTEKDRARYDPDQAGLCFRCHRSELATLAISSDITRFRNGERNLHQTHVQSLGRGRTCRVCHNPHAAANSALIHESMSFVGLQLPFRFEKTAQGGTCATACHGVMRYDRAQEAANAKSR